MTEQTQFALKQLEQMRQGVSYFEEISLRSFKLKVRPLTISENLTVSAEVVKRITGLQPHEQTAVAENTFLAQETLMRAAKPTPETSDMESAMPQMLMAAMTPDEVSALYKQYVTIMEKTDPILEEIPSEEVKRLAEEVKKKECHPTKLSFLQLASLVKYLVTQLESLEDK
jgi:uncharacterized FlaG/YvyC family protein